MYDGYVDPSDPAVPASQEDALLRDRILRVRAMRRNGGVESLHRLQGVPLVPKCQRDPAAFFSGDDALQAAVAALACSVGILTIGALVMLMLPVGVG
jgi:hypothetical protein